MCNSVAASVQNGVGTSQGYGSDYFNQDYVIGGTATGDVNPQGTAASAWLYGSETYFGAGAIWNDGSVAPQLYTSTNGYDATVNVNPVSSAAHLYMGFISTTSASYLASIYYNWGRARAWPPNGVMPSTSFGSVNVGTSSPTISDTLGDTFTLGVSSSVSSSGSTYDSAIWYGSAMSAGADTITATFPSAIAGSVSLYEVTGYSTAVTPVYKSGSSSTGSTSASAASLRLRTRSWSGTWRPAPPRQTTPWLRLHTVATGAVDAT